MRVLAIDTALGACAACVYDQNERRILARESLLLDRGHAEALMPLIDSVIARVEGGFSILDRVAVTVGPGSYTGLRVGVSAARAIGLAIEKPVVGVSTLSALAAPLIAAAESTVVAAVIDARNEQVYMQVVSPRGRPIVAARQTPLREAARAIGAGPVRLVGSGAPKLAAEAWLVGLQALVVDAPVAPDIEWVARLGAFADPEQAAAKPLYLKAPDAKPQDHARIARR